MKRSHAFSWATISLLAIALILLLFHRQRAQRDILQRESQSLSAERAQLQQKLFAVQEEKSRLNDYLQQARPRANQPPLNPAEARQRDLAVKLVEFSSLESAKRGPRPFDPSGESGLIFPELMDDPDYSRSVGALWRPQVEIRYGPWLKNLADSPADRVKIENLLVEHLLAEYDAKASALRSGLDPKKDRDEIFRLQRKIQEGLETELKQQLGESEYSGYLAHEKTVFARESLLPLVRRLSYSEEPLTSAQIDQIASSMPGPSSPYVKTTIEAALLPAKAFLSARQWDEIEAFVREGGTLLK